MNQYGAAMSRPLPQKDFEWCTDKKWTSEKDMEKVSESILQIDPESNTGYFFEVKIKMICRKYFIFFIIIFLIG